METLVDILLVIILLLFAAVTAASEISVIAASRIKLRRLANGGSKAAKIILKILEVPERFFGTILVANNIVDSLIAIIVMGIVMRFMRRESASGVLIATLLASFAIIISEVASKTFAARYSEKLAMFLAHPLRGLIILLSPVVKIVEIITKKIMKLAPAGSEIAASAVTEEEIRAIMKIGEEEGSLHKEKFKMLSKVFDFSETIVRNIMTPKKDIVSIDINMGLEDILEKALEHGYSRIPVHSEDHAKIIGVINMKDLLSLSCNRSLVVLYDILYPVTYVQGSKKITELLKEFQKGHTHLAVVTDDAGKVEGIVTLEDVLEEIVGEIEDEYDVRTNTSGLKI